MEVSACEANNTGGHGPGRTEREEATLGRHLDRLLRCSSEATKVTKAKQKSQKEQEHLVQAGWKAGTRVLSIPRSAPSEEGNPPAGAPCFPEVTQLA